MKYTDKELKNIQSAVREYHNINKSIRKVAVEFGIPRSTLGQFLNGSRDTNRSPGRPTLFSELLEEMLFYWIVVLNSIGAAPTKWEVHQKIPICVASFS